MAGGRSDSVAWGFGRLFGGAGTTVGLGEAELLERFAHQRDEAAFEAIVARHGPMVLGVCRRFLPAVADAEDAFQATFLVLVRRAGTLRDGDRLGPWLHGVALKVARRARQEASRRAEKETGGDALTAFEPSRGAKPETLGADLHEELGLLPDRYRAPIVLCDLEGRTHEEAALLLRCPVGTVKGRLSRARDLLRNRLVRRGLAPTTAALALTLRREATAGVAPALIESTVRAAMTLAAGGGGALAAGTSSAAALRLAEGVLTTMTLHKLQTAAAVLLTTGVLAAGTGVLAYQQSGGPAQPNEPSAAVPAGRAADAEPPRPAEPSTPADVAATEEIVEARRELARAKLGPLKLAYVRAVNEILQSDNPAVLRERSVALLISERQLTEDAEARNRAIQNHLQRMLEFAEASAIEEKMAPNDMIHRVLATESKVWVAEAKLWIAESKAGRPLTGLPLADEPIETISNPVSQADDPQNRAILAALETSVAMPFSEPTPLEDILKYVRSATQSEALPQGIPIYVEPEPIGQEKGKEEPGDQPMMQRRVTMDLDGIRLKTTLRLALKQVGLGYIVKDGLVMVGEPNSTGFARELGVGNFGFAATGVPGYGEIPPRIQVPQQEGGMGGAGAAGVVPGGGFR